MMRTTGSSALSATSGSRTGQWSCCHLIHAIILCWHCHPHYCICITHWTTGLSQHDHAALWAYMECILPSRRIPHEYLRGTKQFLGSPLPDSPLLVFINSRSGGRAGTRLAEVLCHAIGHSQVPGCTAAPPPPIHPAAGGHRSQRLAPGLMTCSIPSDASSCNCLV